MFLSPDPTVHNQHQKEINITYARHMMADCCCAPNSSGPEIDITPQDLTISDNVTIILSIK